MQHHLIDLYITLFAAYLFTTTSDDVCAGFSTSKSGFFALL